MRALVATWTLSVLLVAGCGGDKDPKERRDVRTVESTATTNTPPSTPKDQPAPGRPSLRLVKLGDFDQPVHVMSLAGQPGIMVVEKTGRLVQYAKDAKNKPRFIVLDLSDKVSTGSEQGLLGAAAHPDFAANGRLFLNYTDVDGNTHVAEQRFDPKSLERKGKLRDVLTIDQPYANHNGGHLAFAPDGSLWIGTGDGGAAGDPENNAQDRRSLLGKMIRLDVDAGEPEPELVALGLRNPWRYDFDEPSGSVVIGDVGQGEFEEIDTMSAKPGGLVNFGWDLKEGTADYEGGSRQGPGALTGPIAQYSHDEGCSITGGVVYRGTRNPSLRGWYIYADFCQDWIRAFPYAGTPRPDRTVELKGVSQISSFAEGSDGEVYVTSLAGGVYGIGR
jgi:glucose/arabinose dehydrogenase